MENLHSFVYDAINTHGLSVLKDDIPENDREIIFVKSKDFTKLKSVFNDIKEHLRDRVECYRYTPVSGNMNELTLGFRVLKKTPAIAV